MDEHVIETLKNRRVLLERDVLVQRSLCAKMYLNQVLKHSMHALVFEYDRELLILTNLEDELRQVNIFIGE